MQAVIVVVIDDQQVDEEYYDLKNMSRLEIHLNYKGKRICRKHGATSCTFIIEILKETVEKTLTFWCIYLYSRTDGLKRVNAESNDLSQKNPTRKDQSMYESSDSESSDKEIKKKSKKYKKEKSCDSESSDKERKKKSKKDQARRKRS